jgi:hypothetical protein
MTATWLIPLALYLASGFVNYALAFRSAEQWAEYCALNPRGAAVRRALRKIGLDLPGLIRLALPPLLRALQGGLASRARLPGAQA